MIAAGGTGGHIYPAQGFAEQLLAINEPSEILFVAGGLAKNRYFDRSRFPYKEVACSPIISKNPIKLAKGLYNLVKGTKDAMKIMNDFNPDVVVAFGSFYTVPVVLAARLLKVPYILHEANSIPGKANKWLSRYAQAVGVHFPMTRELLKGNVMEVGMPLRLGYRVGSVSKNEALGYYGLKDGITTILIFGGSQGAQGINRLMKNCKLSDVQIIHITGKEEEVELFRHLYQAQNISAAVKPFESHMLMAWHAADLFIGRSGASTVAEALEFEMPGILIPYPHATDNHQDKNADYLVDTVGSAIKFAEHSLTAEQLMSAIKNLDTRQMKKNVQQYKLRPNKIDLYQLVMKSISKFC